MANITFVWQGLSQNKIYGHWGDGLRAAMDIVEKHHNVTYKEPWEDITDTDLILYWEAPVTYQGENGEHYKKVQNNPAKKILLFAGGQIKPEWCDGFDMFLVESKINEDEFEELGYKWKRAFGVDTKVLKPEKQPKVWDACFPGTCAGWKRQPLFSKTLKEKGVICGRFQPTDPSPFNEARANGTLVLPELSYEAVTSIYNASHCCVNTSEYWGGGQRTTLEAMACGIPVIVMSDSPKNIEYVVESGAGLVVEPDEVKIREAIEEIKNWSDKDKQRGIDYVQSKWTHEHYANNILEAIKEIL